MYILGVCFYFPTFLFLHEFLVLTMSTSMLCNLIGAISMWAATENIFNSSLQFQLPYREIRVTSVFFNSIFPVFLYKWLRGTIFEIGPVLCESAAATKAVMFCSHCTLSKYVLLVFATDRLCPKELHYIRFCGCSTLAQYWTELNNSFLH